MLAADVVGYSRLIGVDETGTLAKLRQIRRDVVNPVLAEHGGRIFKLMGDGMLADFP
jgi:adenylate cyclase